MHQYFDFLLELICAWLCKTHVQHDLNIERNTRSTQKYVFRGNRSINDSDVNAVHAPYPKWKHVAKRPRDASCLSVVSFNSTKRRVESFIVSYVGYRFVTACS